MLYGVEYSPSQIMKSRFPYKNRENWTQRHGRQTPYHDIDKDWTVHLQGKEHYGFLATSRN